MISSSALQVVQPEGCAQPAKLFVETTTYCNLACSMCVKHAPDSRIGDQHMAFATFARLEPVFKDLQALLLNGIGEPLMHPQLEEFIRFARCRMPLAGRISFQSNGLLLDAARARALAEAGLDSICISLDALSPATFRKIRQGAEVASVQSAFQALAELRRTQQPVPQLGVEFVVKKDNLHELPEVISWAAQQGARFAIVTQLMPYAEAQVGQTGYDGNTDRAAALFEKWQGIARQRGLDLGAYPEQAWAGDRTRDRRLLDLVEEMIAEARQGGVFIHLRQLFDSDRLVSEQAAEVFAATAELADRLGIELKLPAVRPQHERHCSFVEEGGAFVAWNGDVHPCYNLWHAYRCFLNGWQKEVDARVFGNINQAPLGELWQQRSWREFRDNVLRYDYPYCTNCSVAPCDYIEKEPFEQDCYLQEEPCGACLWGMGLLHCLQ